MKSAMKRLDLCLVFLFLVGPLPVVCAGGPTMEQVVWAPQNYAGATIEFSEVTLSGKITPYDLGGVRKYYLTLGSRGRTFEVGFFLAPPALADKLAAGMNPQTNYWVNLVCRIEKISINGVPQWHGIVTRVDFLDEEGEVTETVSVGR
jgi:hypothetical protein